MPIYPARIVYKWLREINDWGGSITFSEIRDVYGADMAVFESMHLDGYLKSEEHGYLITDQGRHFISIYRVMES